MTSPDRAPPVELQDWADRLEAGCRGTRFDPALVRVLATCDSTQDVARSTGPGAVVVAGRQTRGRGRLGRRWIEDLGTGVAISLATKAEAVDRLLLGSTVGVLGAIRAALPASERRRVGIKFPNDLVERRCGAKVGGILVEVADDVAVIGIGVNVHRRTWPEGLSAIGLEELGAAPGYRRIDLIETLPGQIANALDADPATLAARFVAAHLPTGRRVEIECGDRVHRGTLEALDPAGSLRVRGDDGVVEAWPAASTRILSWEPGGDDCARVDPPGGPMT